MMKKFYEALPALVFTVFLAVMALLLFLLPHKTYSENEKRNLAGFPEVTAQSVMEGEFQEDLETFTADQIPGRDFFVGVNAYWTLLTGRNAAQDIYYCADDYLINAPKPYNEQIFTDNLTRFDQFAAKAGVTADIIMVPSTGYIMEDVLPANHGEYHDDLLYEKAGEILQHTQIIDVRDTLKEGAESGQVCYRTDHHLTSYGNYLLYKDFQVAHGKPYNSRDAYQVTACDGFYGTTWSGSGYWFTPADAVELWDSGAQVQVTLRDGQERVQSDSLFFPDHLENMDKYPVFLDGNHSIAAISNPQAEGGALLVIRDSYAHCFSTFLADGYQTVYLVDLRYYRESLSQFMETHRVDRILYLYGVDNLMTDTNSAWLN